MGTLFSSQCYYKPKTTLRNEIFKYEKKDSLNGIDTTFRLDFSVLKWSSVCCLRPKDSEFIHNQIFHEYPLCTKQYAKH